MAESEIENTMDSNAIGVVVQCPCSASDVEIVPRKVTMMADVLERQIRGERIAIIGGGQSWGKTMAMRIAMAANAQPMPLVIVDTKPNNQTQQPHRA